MEQTSKHWEYSMPHDHTVMSCGFFVVCVGNLKVRDLREEGGTYCSLYFSWLCLINSIICKEANLTEWTAHFQITVSGLGKINDSELVIWFISGGIRTPISSTPCVYTILNKHHSNNSHSCIAVGPPSVKDFYHWSARTGVLFGINSELSIGSIAENHLFWELNQILFIMLDHHILLFLCPGLFWLAGVQQVQDDLEASVGACTVIMLQACSLSRSDASLCCPFSALIFL